MSKNSSPTQDEQKPPFPEAQDAVEEITAAIRVQLPPREAGEPQIAEYASPYSSNGYIANQVNFTDREAQAFSRFVEDALSENSVSSSVNESSQGHQQMLDTLDETRMGGVSSEARYSPRKIRSFRDFEVLWFVKFGDIASFQDHCVNEGINIITFCDNQGRNALHYAADNGSIPMLELLIALGVPYLRSQKGMTPMDVALLTNQSSEFKELLAKLAQNNNGPQAGNLVEEGKTFEDVRRKFAPEPPKFVISRRPPTPVVFSQNVSGRSFWKCQLRKENGKDVVVLDLGAIAKAPDAEAGIRVVDSNSNHGDLASGIRAVNRLYDGWGLSSFLKPLDYVAKDGKEQGIGGSALNKVVVQTAIPVGEAAVENSAPDLPVGVVAGMVLHGNLEGVGAPTEVSGCEGKSSFAVAGYLAVNPAHQGKEVSSMLMSSLWNHLLVRHGCTALSFTMQTLIPQLPASTSMIKWHRRVLNPNTIFKSPYAEAIFPEFYEEDEVLRADCVLKGTLALESENVYMIHVSGWSCVDSTDEQLHILFDFLRNCGKEGLELVYKWWSEEDLCNSLFPHDYNKHIKAFVRISMDTGMPEDLIVFRLRQMRDQSSRAHDFPAGANMENASGGQESIVVAQVVYAHFTRLRGAEKMSHILCLAQDLLHADVLLIPNLFGFTESDLVKSNFVDVPMWREMLYVLVKEEGRENEGPGPVAKFVPPTQAPKISLPIFLL